MKKQTVAIVLCRDVAYVRNTMYFYMYVYDVHVNKPRMLMCIVHCATK